MFSNCASYSTSRVDVERYERFFFINTYIGFSIVEGLLVIIGLTKGSQCFARPWCNVMHERDLDVN